MVSLTPLPEPPVITQFPLLSIWSVTFTPVKSTSLFGFVTLIVPLTAHALSVKPVSETPTV